MKAIYLIYDPKSAAYNSGDREVEDVKKDISENFLNDKSFNWNDVKDIVDAYKKDCRSKIEKLLDHWELELKEREEFQKSLPWDTERKEKDDMLTSQSKLFEEYLKIKSKVEKERTESEYHSGVEKSILEQMSK